MKKKINSGIPDSTWIIMKHREQSNLPPKYVIIYAFGDGDYAVLNYEKNNQGNNVVEIWSPGKSAFQFLSNDFGEFFYEQIKQIFN